MNTVNTTFDNTTSEELYDIITDHFMYCEEDSWEKDVDLDTWTTQEMVNYANEYIGA